MRQLVVLARWPAPGRCKGRLARSCGSAPAAARVQAALTVHTLAAARLAAERCQARVVLAVDGLGDRARRRWGRQLGIEHVRHQGRGCLGCRMQRQLRLAFGEGADQVVLIGSDLPGLEGADLEQAFSVLENGPLVLGPAEDGGYWLIGLNRAGQHRAGAQLMSGIPWGTAAVLESTLERASALELPGRLLRRQADLDNRTDMTPWLRPGWPPISHP
jgi:rSAM/selenodomain-associated transferase 1